MKKITPLSLGGLFLFALLQFSFTNNLTAQSTNSGVTIRLTVNGVNTDFTEGECGFGSAEFGGFPDVQLCAPAVWAHDVNGLDSLVCDSIPVGSLTGKIALVRRGGCPVAAAGNFVAKAWNAQRAGAQAVLVANHYANAAQTGCTVQNMTGTDANVTVPVFFLSRNMAEAIDAAIGSGQAVEICILPPNVRITSSFFPVQNAQTPVSQIATDTFGFSANVTNVRGEDLTNVILKAQVLTSAGAELYSTSITIPLLTGDVVDSAFVIPGLYVPELPVGQYFIVYSTDSDPLGDIDVPHFVRNNFSVTENLFAKDNNVTNAIRPSEIPTTGYALANLYIMSAGALDNYEVKTIEFAHYTNPGEPEITTIDAELSVFKVNQDLVDAGWSFAVFDRTAYLSNSFTLKGTGSYSAAPTATQGQIHQVEIIDFDSALPGVKLDNGSQYVVSVFYPDSSRFAFTAVDEDVDLAGPNGLYTLSYSNQWYGGFAGGPAAAMIRMYIDLVVTTDETPLPDSYMKVFPNPVKDVLNLGLNLEKPTDVTVTIAELSGRVINIQDKQGVTNETLTYQVPQLASGMYLARIATKEGTLTKKFVVQK